MRLARVLSFVGGLAVVMLLLAGCNAGTGQPADVGSAPAIKTASLPVPDSALGRGAVEQTDYHIAALDELDVSVFQVPDLNRTVRVDGSGQISLPLIGAIKAGGKTTHELEAAIATKLGDKYLQSPQVSVLVKQAVGQHVTVDGAVRRPGVYPVAGQVSLSEALAMAGGLDDLADLHGVLVFRTANQKRMVAVFDVAAIRDGTQSDPPVYASDTIVADQSAGRSAWKAVRETLPAAALFTPLL